MERNTFKTLLTSFTSEEIFDKKVEILLSYELKSLTNPQIQKILDTLNEDDTKKLIKSISKKLEE